MHLVLCEINCFMYNYDAAVKIFYRDLLLCVSYEHIHTHTEVYLQFEHSGAFAQHHLDKVPVVDSVAAAAARHFHDHLLQLQVGLGYP